MVNITNGISTFVVTRGAFDGIYSRQGYRVIKEEKAHGDDITKQVNVPEKTEDERFIENVLEKPISQWSKEEIKRFAILNHIDISGTKNANEAKAIIKEFVDSQSQK